MKKSFFHKKVHGKFVYINEENKSKEIQGKNVLSFTKFVLGGFCPGGVWLGGFCPGLCRGFMSGGGFVLTPIFYNISKVWTSGSYFA